MATGLPSAAPPAPLSFQGAPLGQTKRRYTLRPRPRKSRHDQSPLCGDQPACRRLIPLRDLLNRIKTALSPRLSGADSYKKRSESVLQLGDKGLRQDHPLLHGLGLQQQFVAGDQHQV